MGISRRQLARGMAGAATLGLLGTGTGPALARRPYRGPNVIVIRFGGGVRRRETIDPDQTYAPFLRKVLAGRGVLIPNVVIDSFKDVDTSHAEGTLNLLTGRYRSYRKVGARGLAPLLEPDQPTLFEHLRKAFDIPVHQALLVNGEDRPQEEYLTYGGHKHYGVAYRSEVLGLYRYKLHKFKRILAEARLPEKELEQVAQQLGELSSHDYRGTARALTPEIERFWDLWRAEYGDSGRRSARGDRLLTDLAVRALHDLKPRLMMVNYQDPDYVHWGNPSHYTRAITVIDRGLRQLVMVADALPEYRENTVFVIVPDCGRDANPLMAVPFQHHFNSKSAHEIFALVFGPGIVRGRVLDKAVDQTSIATTVAAVMGLTSFRGEGRALDEILT